MIPVSNCLINVIRVTPGDGYDEPTNEPMDVGVRAVISEGSGQRGYREEGTVNTVTHKLTCDPVTIFPGDLIVDQTSGRMYTVLWSTPHNGPLPVSHTSAGLTAVTHG